MAIVAPSLLAADFLKLQDECALVNNSTAEWLHLDVMDGRFVPNISYGPMVIEFVKKACTKVLDVHLMIVEPEKYVEAFKKAGAEHITVHIETCTHLHRNIQQIKGLGMKAGVALNPHTPVSLLENIITDVDILLLMSVNPGFGGQTFIPETLQKIKQAKKLITDKNAPTLIEIDGGVTLENAKAIVEAGADVLVAGSTVFKSASPLDTIEALHKIS